MAFILNDKENMNNSFGFICFFILKNTENTRKSLEKKIFQRPPKWFCMYFQLSLRTILKNNNQTEPNVFSGTLTLNEWVDEGWNNNLKSLPSLSLLITFAVLTGNLAGMRVSGNYWLLGHKAPYTLVKGPKLLYYLHDQQKCIVWISYNNISLSCFFNLFLWQVGKSSFLIQKCCTRFSRQDKKTSFFWCLQPSN